MKKIFLLKEDIFKGIKHNSNFLYHVTNIDNLQDIENYGLLPKFGQTLKGVYGSEYDFDNQYDEDDYDVPVKVPIPGILFFSDIPSLKYSQFFSKEKFDWSKALLCIVEKNDTIYKRLDDENVITSDGEQAHSIRFNRWDYVNVQDLPIFIESGDWFSLEEQDVEHLIFGPQLISFMKQNFPNDPHH